MDQADVTVKRKRGEAGDEDADAGPLFSTEEQLDYEFKSEVEYDAFRMTVEATDHGRKRVNASLLRKVRRKLFLKYHSDKAGDEGNRFVAVIDWIKDTFKEDHVAYWQKSVDEYVDEFEDETGRPGAEAPSPLAPGSEGEAEVEEVGAAPPCDLRRAVAALLEVWESSGLGSRAAAGGRV